MLARLVDAGVEVTAEQAAASGDLRRLRNRLSTTRRGFNERAGLATCRDAIVFAATFGFEHFGVRVLDAVALEDRPAMLAIGEVAAIEESLAEREVVAVLRR